MAGGKEPRATRIFWHEKYEAAYWDGETQECRFVKDNQEICFGHVILVTPTADAKLTFRYVSPESQHMFRTEGKNSGGIRIPDSIQGSTS